MWFLIVPDGRPYLELIPECHPLHADPSIQNSYDTQLLGNLSLHQIGAGGGEGKSSSSIHLDSPFEVSRRSKVSKSMHNLGPCRDQAISKPSVLHLPPLRTPPANETLRSLPPALPSTILRPLPTIAFAGMSHPPISPSTSPCPFQDQQSQGLTGNAMSIDYPGPEDLHSRLSLSPAHKDSIDWALSDNIFTEFSSQWSARLQKPIMRYGGQQEISGPEFPALQETGHSGGFNSTPESSGQSFYGFRFTSMRFRR